MSKATEQALIREQIMLLSKFWVRPNGLSFDFVQLKPLASLKDEERLFTAILRKDKKQAFVLAKIVTQAVWSAFGDLVRSTNFSRLVLDNCCELMLLEYVPEQLRTEWTRMSMRESYEQKQADSTFGKILDGLTPYSVSPVWIKGVSLSRTAYAESSHRQYSDLDVVIHPSCLGQFYRDLEQLGYERVFGAGFCNQYGVGPVESVDDLLLAPADGWLPSSALTLQKKGWPMIDVKVNPYDSGMRPNGFDSFFERSTSNRVRDSHFWAPCYIDHLILSLHHLYKDRFASLKTLYDVHTLVGIVNKIPNGWSEFLARCKSQAMDYSAWAGLLLCVDRYGAVVPYSVLAQLKPPTTIFSKALIYTVSPYFVWNATSVPMMLVSSLVSLDWLERYKLIVRSIFPSRSFLRHYYGRHLANQNLAIMLHWLLFFLPGGVIRNWLGLQIFPSPTAAMQEKAAQRELQAAMRQFVRSKS